MPEKTVSIRIDLQETDVKNKLKELASEMKVLSTEAQLNEKAFAGQQNSLDALTAKYNNYLAKIKNLNEQIEAHRQGQSNLQADLKKVQEQLENATKKQESYKLSTENVTKVMQKWSAIRDEAERQGKEELAKYNELEKALAKLDRQYKGSKRESEEYKTKHKELSDQLERSGKRLGELQNQYKKADTIVKRSESTIKTWTDRAEAAGKEVDNWKNKEAALTQGINRHVAETNKAEAKVTEYTNTVDLLAEAIARAMNNYRGIDEETDRWTGDLKKSERAVEALADALVLRLVQQGFNVVKEAVTGSIDAFKEYETALAGVSKTTGMKWGGEEIKSLGEDFKQLSLELPVSASELLNVAQIAGQLGIKGSENIKKFTEVMAQMSVSTNLSAEEAATAMAQMAAVTGMAASDYDKLGSAIVALGNNFPTSEDVIIRIAQRFSGAAVNANLAESSIVALAAAAGSVGLQAESAGTSLSKLIQKMGTAVDSGEGLETWARVANMEAEDFAKLWGEDAAQAVARFMDGFGKLGSQATSTFGELEIGEARLQDLVRRMSNAEATSHLLTNALRESNEAFSLGVALENEAKVAFETLNSQMGILQDAVNVLGIDVGTKLAPQVTALVDGATDIVKAIDDIIKKDPGLVYVLEGITAIIGVLTADYLVKTVPLLKNTIEMFKGLAEVLTVENLASKFVSIAEGVVSFTGALISMLPVIAAVGAAFAALYFLSKNGDYDSVDILTKKTEKYTETLKTRAEVEQELREVHAKLKVAQYQYRDEVERTGMANEATEQTIAELTAAYNALLEILGMMPEEVEEATEAEEAFAYTTLENTQKIKELTNAFADNISKVKDFSTKYTTTAKSYIKDIEQQIKWHDTYAANREKLLSRDIKGLEEWVATWDDGTEEAAKKMAAFAGATDEQIMYLINTLLPGLAEASKKNMDSAEQEFKEAWDNIHWYAKDRVADIQRAIDTLHGKEILITFKNQGVVSTYDAINAQGLDYVPYDGFVSMLHEGEKVLNRAEASAYRKLERTVSNTTNNNNNNNVVLNVYGGKGQSADELSDIIMKKIQQATNRRQAVWA